MSGDNFTRLLVIGASGLVGRRLVQTLLVDGKEVKALARNPARIADLEAAGCAVEAGDIADPLAVRRAVRGCSAVCITIHTLSPQPGRAKDAGFMEIEMAGMRNVIAAATVEKVRRVMYVTSQGIAPDARSAWLSERWKIEQLLLDSGLDATVFRPGCIIGRGGHGFDTLLANARRHLAISLSGDKPLFRSIAVDDLVYYLIQALHEPNTFGQRFDVGNDDVLSMNQMTDITAHILGRSAPFHLQPPPRLLKLIAPLLDRLARLPRGAALGLVESLAVDSIGDPTPIRRMLPNSLMTFEESVRLALHGGA